MPSIVSLMITTLLPVVDRLSSRFGIEEVTVVADRGMISKKTMKELEARQMKYILGARMRSVIEVRDEVLSRPGAYRMVTGLATLLLHTTTCSSSMMAVAW